MTHDVRPAQAQTNNPHIFFDNPAKKTVLSRTKPLRTLGPGIPLPCEHAGRQQSGATMNPLRYGIIKYTGLVSNRQ